MRPFEKRDRKSFLRTFQHSEPEDLRDLEEFLKKMEYEGMKVKVTKSSTIEETIIRLVHEVIALEGRIKKLEK